MTTDAGDHPATPRWLWFWRLALTIAGTCAAIWFWIMPGGFPVDHPRFWVNRVIPLLVLAAAITGRVAVGRKNWSLVQAAALALASGCTAGLIAAVTIFPVSALLFVLPGAFVVMICWLAYARAFRGLPILSGSRRVSVIGLASAAAVASVWAQRGPEASTLPLNVPAPDWQLADPGDLTAIVSLSGDVDVAPAAETVRVNVGGLSMSIAPSLTFESRSPDRCWTILSPRGRRLGPWRKLTGARVDSGATYLKYDDDGAHWLRVAVERSRPEVSVDAVTRLDESIYSHLNSFCELTIRGHKRMSFAFSPCAETRIEALPADYPNGRPRRLAYLSADGVFRVVEASSGEKGPFVELASGPLDRDEPLIVTLFDADKPVCEVGLLDWAAQASVELSPTAGWGLPANAIEFERLGDSPTAAVAVWITLAGTSVGRGWDSVGHRAGTYRNRIMVRAARTDVVPAVAE